jgi:hypothetical protein
LKARRASYEDATPCRISHADYRCYPHLLRPDIAAKIVIATHVVVPNTKIKQHLPKDICNNPMIFIPEDILENLRVQANLSFRDERMLMRKWTHFSSPGDFRCVMVRIFKMKV